MKERFRQLLPHLLAAWLETAGLLLALLGLLGLSSFSFPAILIATAVLLVSGFGRMNRKTAFSVPVLLVAAVAVWFTAGNGITVIRDVLLGATLQFSGIPASLELVGQSAAFLLAVLLALLVFWISVPDFGGIFLFLLSLFVFVLIWYFNRFDLLWTFAPAAAASFIYAVRFSEPEVSVFRFLPWIAALIAASLLLTPKEGITVLPMKEAADELRQTVTDTFFFTEPRNVFSLADEGFYPQGRSQLGGKVELTDSPVMEVAASERLWLRGVTMDEYTGRNWQSTNGGRRYLWTAQAWLKDRSRIFNAELPSSGSFRNAFSTVDFSIRILSHRTSTLFLPQRIREIRPGGNLVPYYNASSEVFITRDLQPGDTYSGTAYNFVSGTPGLSNLIDACALSADPDMDEVFKLYTVLPGHLEQRVWDLAASIITNAATPYEKAFTIQNWLSRNYRYTLDTGEEPGNIDFVTNFLFNTKEGYCTYFASAMTVLCRMAGLPARYVEGYLAIPEADGTVLVTGRDAHAWTEVYFSGFGWVTFDATPGFGSGQDQVNPSPAPTPLREKDGQTPEPDTKPEETPTPAPDSTPESTPVPSDDPSDVPHPDTDHQEHSAGNGSFGGLWIPFLFILAILAALLVRIRMTDPENRAKKAPGEYDVWDIWTQDLFDALHAGGADMRPGETPMSFTRRCEEEGVTAARLSTAGECISLICYGHVVPIETDSALIRDLALSCRQELVRSDRIRYVFRRAFVPVSKRRYDRFKLS